MRATATIATACALFVLTGCRAAERFQNNVTRRLQSAAVCSLLSITASPDAAGSDPSFAPGPVQVKRASRATTPSAPAPAPAMRVERRAANGTAQRAARERQLARPRATALEHAHATPMTGAFAFTDVKTDPARMAKRTEKRIDRRLIIRMDTPTPVAPAQAVETIIIETRPLEITLPHSEPCKSRPALPASGIIPITGSALGPISTCGPAASWPCADAAPQR